MVPQERNVVLCVVLVIVTCGLYAIYWNYKMLDEMYTYTGQQNNAVIDVVIGFFTLWIFSSYKMAKLENEANAKAGLPAEDKAMMYIILSVLMLSLVVDILTQLNLNKIATGNK